jgi:hypothetical protein
MPSLKIRLYFYPLGSIHFGSGYRDLLQQLSPCMFFLYGEQYDMAEVLHQQSNLKILIYKRMATFLQQELDGEAALCTG